MVKVVERMQQFGAPDWQRGEEPGRNTKAGLLAHPGRMGWRTYRGLFGGAGKGSELVVRLPLARLAHANPSATAASAALRGLLVDDSVAAALAMSRVPESDGHNVGVAHGR
jgi:hypothetical protein